MSTAQDEFDALAGSQRTHTTHHPSDSSSDVDSSSDTDAAHHYTRSGPSLRSRNQSHHNRNADSDDVSDDDDDWDDRYGNGTSGLAQKKGPAYTIPKGDVGRRGNTGPKGVIADARAAEREKRERQRAVMLAARGLNGHRAAPVDEREEEGRKWYQDADAQIHEDEYEEDAAEKDEADDGFMQQWRRKRMDELEMAKANGTIGADAAGSRRGQGKVQVVDALGYLDAVEEAPRGVVVVVFIADFEVRGFRSLKGVIACRC